MKQTKKQMIHLMICMIHFHEVPRIGKFPETGSRIEVTKGTLAEGSECGELGLRGTEIQFGMMRKFWRWVGRWMHSSVNVLPATDLDT